jgi:hypothetical protein
MLWFSFRLFWSAMMTVRNVCRTVRTKHSFDPYTREIFLQANTFTALQKSCKSQKQMGAANLTLLSFAVTVYLIDLTERSNDPDQNTRFVCKCKLKSFFCLFFVSNFSNVCRSLLLASLLRLISSSLQADCQKDVYRGKEVRVGRHTTNLTLN